MASLNFSLSKQDKLSPSNLPTKRSINLVYEPKDTVKATMAIPLIILGIVLGIAGSKYLIIDRFEQVAAARARVAKLEADLDAGYEELKGFDDLTEIYAKFTTSGMTDEELTRSDRVEVMTLLESVVMPRVKVANWTLSSNTLTINIAGTTLQQINLIVQSLNEDPIVRYCTVQTAVSRDNQKDQTVVTDETTVTALIIVYLNSKA
ncbi:MAG: hypothetical protein J6Y90_05910 [Lachnospiraceae bacterium]|nr:hypothetical protein [Lachnospiraceae bacterium]